MRVSLIIVMTVMGIGVGQDPLEDRILCHRTVLAYFGNGLRNVFIGVELQCAELYIHSMIIWREKWTKCEWNKTCMEDVFLKHRGFLSACLFSDSTNPFQIHNFDYWWLKVEEERNFQETYLRCFECRDLECYNAVTKDLPVWDPEDTFEPVNMKKLKYFKNMR